jgi:hypothetical protein
MRKLFTFGFVAFSDHAENDVHRIFVLSVDGTEAQFDAFEAALESDQFIHRAALEDQYGRHEVAFNPQFEILGFGSMDVTVEKQDELFEKWAQVFRDFGFEVGETSILTEDEYEAVEAAQWAKLEAGEDKLEASA